MTVRRTHWRCWFNIGTRHVFAHAVSRDLVLDEFNNGGAHFVFSGDSIAHMSALNLGCFVRNRNNIDGTGRSQLPIYWAFVAQVRHVNLPIAQLGPSSNSSRWPYGRKRQQHVHKLALARFDWCHCN